MAGDALPLANFQNPRVREASDVVIRLALIRALSVIDTCDHRRVAKKVRLDVVDVGGGWLEARSFDIGKKSLLVAQFAVPFGVHEPARKQGLEGSRIAVDLSHIPQALQNQQLALAWIGLLGGHSDRAQGQQKTATEIANHFLNAPRHTHVGRTCQYDSSR